MSDVRYTKNGLLIPTAWLKKLGQNVRIQRGTNIVIIESKQRQAARRRLAQMVRKLRRAGEELGTVSQDEIKNLVNEVRQSRAGHR
jgi:mevalonate kinase